MHEIDVTRLLHLWSIVAEPARGDDCASLEDFNVLRDRALSKGLSCLTDDLADFGRYAMAGFRDGILPCASEIGWETKVNSTLPLFLNKALSKVFADDGKGRGATFESMPDGTLRLTAWRPPLVAGVAVGWIRQLTTVFSKMRIPHTTEQAVVARDRFVENERLMRFMKGVLWDPTYLTETCRYPLFGGQVARCQTLVYILQNARRLIGRVLCDADPREIAPRHGSGASACRSNPWERYEGLKYDPEIASVWPYVEFSSAGKSHCDQILSGPSFVNYGYPKRARAVFVPKDSRGPRLISCEPATSMYYQQGLMSLLVETIESHPLTRGSVNFTDQQVNQVKAREGSISRKLATLDLKDASDRLSLDVVRWLFPDRWYRALCAVRSRSTVIDIPSQGSMRVPLLKHAPMGSATCFPVMALVIWALIKAAHFARRAPQVYVYGDDIICSTDESQSVMDLLESVGFAVNRGKSFYTATPFRESCGKEYWDGSDVTPVYCRAGLQMDDQTRSALCAFATNIARTKGAYKMAEVSQYVSKWTGCPIIGLPCHNDAWASPDLVLLGQQASAFGFLSEERMMQDALHPQIVYGADYLCQKGQLRSKADRSPQYDYNRTVHRVRVAEPQKEAVKPVSWGYVLRSLLIGGDLGFAESVALTKRVSYKFGWRYLG